MAASGSGGYGGPNFGQIESELRGVAVQFAAILSLTQQLKQSIDIFAQLELQLTMANFAAGGTAESFERMEASARKMALASKFSASQVAESFYELASAGLSVNEVLAASSGVLLLAQATMTDMGSAADLVASTLAQFNLDATETYRVVNLFVAATNNSLATVPKLSFALRQVGPIAAQAGLSIEQTVAALDKLFDAGLRGEQAGTALRNVIARLIDPAGQAAVVLKNLGIEIYDAQGKMRNLNTEILPDLAKAGLTLQDAANIAGTEGASGFLTMLDAVQQTTDGLKDHTKEITGTSDAYSQAVAQMDTLSGSLSRAKNSFNELGLILGGAVAPILISLADAFSQLVLGIRDMESSTIATLAQFAIMGVSIAGLTKVAEGALPAFKLWSKSLELFDKSAINADKSFTRFTSGADGGMKKAAKSATQFATAIGGVVSVASGLIGVALAIGAIGYALIKLQDAKHKAAMQEIADIAYKEAARAGKTGATPQELSAADPKSAAKIAQERRDLANRFDVSPLTGAGAAQAGAATTAALANANKQLEIQADQVRALQFKSAQNRDLIRKTILEAFVQPARDISQLINSGAASDEFATTMQASLGKLANAPASQLREAIAQFYRDYAAAIAADKDISKQEKARILAQIATQAQSATTLPMDALLVVQSEIDKGLIKAEGKAKKLGPLFLKGMGDALKTAAPTNQQLNELFYPMEANYKLLQQQIAGLKLRLTANDAQIQQEIVSTAASKYKNNQEVANAISNMIKADPQALARAMEKVKANGFQIEAGIVSILEEAIARNLITRERVKGYIEKLNSTPVIDVDIVEQQARKAENDLRMGLLRLAEIQGTATVAEYAATYREAAGIQKEDLFSATLTELAKRKGEGYVVSPAAQAAWKQYTEDRTEASFRRFNNMIGQDDTKNYVTNSFRTLTAKLKGVDNQADVAIAGYMKSQENSGNKSSAANKIMRALVRMTTPDEYALERMDVELQLAERWNNFTNDLVEANALAVRRAKVDFVAKIQGLQRDNEKTFLDAIGKNLNDVGITQTLVDAFAGRSIKLADGVILETKDIIQGGEAFEQYVKALEDLLERSIDPNMPQRAEAVAAAQAQVRPALQRMIDAQKLLNMDLKVLGFERLRTVEEIRNFKQEFSNQNMMEELERQLQIAQITGAPLEQFIDLTIKLGKLKVDIDRQTAIRNLQEAFRKAFEGIGGGVMTISGDNINIAMATDATIEQQTAIDSLRMSYGLLLHTINDTASAQKNAMNPEDVYTRRQAVDARIEGLKQKYDSFTMESFGAGIGAAMQKFEAEVPTVFETAMDAMSLAAQGFGDVMASVLTGTAQNWRSATADIMRSIATLIAKMLIMKAVVYTIGLLPHGQAILGFLDLAATVPVTKNAMGGVADSPQVAIFGEGDLPEAFIPMADRRSVQVSYDVAGNPHIQLPSGATIPVTFRNKTTKFAQGGTTDNVIKSSSYRAADGVTGVGESATSSKSSSAGTGVTNVTININIAGDASKDDAEVIAQQAAKQLKAVLDVRESEARRQAHRNSGYSGGYIRAS